MTIRCLFLTIDRKKTSLYLKIKRRTVLWCPYSETPPCPHGRQVHKHLILPIIGLKRSTLHQWIGRGYFCIEQPGTGRTLELIGEELFALAALVCLSRMGWGPNSYVRGLRDSSRIYFRAYREMETPPLRYCVAKGTTFEVEWELSDKPNVEHPIVGACGSKVLPCWAVFDFQDLRNVCW